MGQFSWIAQNTGEPIYESYTRKENNVPKQIVVMIDDKNNKWVEEDYEGYGEFGGKDFYELTAEMNNKELDRSIGIDIYFDGNATNIFPNLYIVKNYSEIDKLKWVPIKPDDDPNQGWVCTDDIDM